MDGTSPSQMQTALDRAKQMRAGGDNASAKSIMRQVKKRARREGGDRQVRNIERNDQEDLKNIGKMESGQQKKLPGSRTSSQQRLTGSRGSSKITRSDEVDNRGLPISVRGGVASAERQSRMPMRSVSNKQDDADFEKFLSNQPKPRITGSGTSSSIVGKRPEAKTNTRRRSAQRMNRSQLLRSKADEIIRKTRNEEISHWREEFLWEVDKKYPDKVKEIKPMSGKNTIIINPEDETSKYKRGY